MAQHYTKAAQSKRIIDAGFERRKTYVAHKNVPLSPVRDSGEANQGKNDEKTTAKKRKWWARRDSNPQPSGYEPPALTIELQARPDRSGGGGAMVSRRRFRSSAIPAYSQVIAAITTIAGQEMVRLSRNRRTYAPDTKSRHGGSLHQPCNSGRGGCAGAGQAAEEKDARITVSGEGNAAVKPDMAVITLSTSCARRRRRARRSTTTTKAMAAVLDAMKKEGIAERDLQDLRLQHLAAICLSRRQRNAAGAEEDRRLPGDQYAERAPARSRQARRAARPVGQPRRQPGRRHQFYQRQARCGAEHSRKAAVADAVAKAKLLTEAAGVKLSRILEISESGGRRSTARCIAWPWPRIGGCPGADRGRDQLHRQCQYRLRHRPVSRRLLEKRGPAIACRAFAFRGRD